MLSVRSIRLARRNFSRRPLPSGKTGCFSMRLSSIPTMIPRNCGEQVTCGIFSLKHLRRFDPALRATLTAADQGLHLRT